MGAPGSLGWLDGLIVLFLALGYWLRARWGGQILFEPESIVLRCAGADRRRILLRDVDRVQVTSSAFVLHWKEPMRRRAPASRAVVFPREGFAEADRTEIASRVSELGKS